VPDTPTSTLILQGLVTAAAGGTGTALIGAVISHRTTKATVSKTVAETGKTEAEVLDVGANTAATQVDTAMDMLREMRTDLGTVRAELAATRSELAATRSELTNAFAQIDVLQRWKTDHEIRMTDHAAWDAEMVQQVRDLGGQIRSAPPLGIPPIGLQPPAVPPHTHP
jgi:DNA repair ATPase RecN